MTALEFEDDNDGFCVGYARILKTPQQERRIKLKELQISDEENSWSGEDEKNGCNSDVQTHQVS